MSSVFVGLDFSILESYKNIVTVFEKVQELDGPQYKLTYFPIDGRAGPIRLMFKVAKQRYKDEKIAFSDWKDLKGSTTWGSMPYLEVDGELITQCRAIVRFVGKRLGFYPENDALAAHCDAIHDVMEDIQAAIMKIKGESKADTIELRQAEIAKGDGLDGGKFMYLYKRLDTFIANKG